MSLATRRTFLFTLASLDILRAAKRKTLVLVDFGSQDGIQEAGYDGFVQDASASGPKPLAIRSGLPRFEDSMDDAGKALRNLADLALRRGAEAVIATHPGLSGNGAFRVIDLERKARMLDIAGAICNSRGLRFLYQNQSLEFTGNAAEERALIAHTDAKLVSYLLDDRVATDPAEFFEINQRRISAIRLSGFRDSLMSAVKRTQWSGWLIVPRGSTKLNG